MKKKLIVDGKYFGALELPETREAPRVFGRIRAAFARKESMGVHLLFSKHRLNSLLNDYQRDGAEDALAHLELYIAMGERLRFDTSDAVELKKQIELATDFTHATLNLAKRLTLSNKKQKSAARDAYLFWDIENFSNVGPMFSDIIEPYAIPDAHIYVAANPNSIFMNGPEWEANLFDYGKTLRSFNFTKCDHGKNVADRVLLDDFKNLSPRNADVFVVTYDRELRDLFNAACHSSNNLYMLSK